MNYLLARNAFLSSCGDPEGEARDRAIAAFDRTLVAQQARLADAWTKFWDDLRKAVGL